MSMIRLRLWCSGAALGAVVAAGCGGGGGAARSADPLSDVRNPRLSTKARVEAVGPAWEASGRNAVDRNVTREAFKAIAWSGSEPRDVRMAALRAVLSDAENEADSRQLVSLMLPHEPDREVVALLGTVAARSGWTDATSALVRSLSRPMLSVKDNERAEWRAIEALHPGRPVEEVVLGVFLDPRTDPGPGDVRYDERVRASAWDLLGRLDPTGVRRAEMLGTMDTSGVSGESRAAVEDIRAAFRDLAAAPVTGEELKWLRSLRDGSKRENAAWWSEATRAISSLDAERRRGLGLRHAEPIRWATANRPEWIAAGRGELLSEVRSRLADRRHYRRVKDDTDFTKPHPDRLADWEERLTWADLLTILVIYDALADERVCRELFRQADLDRDDGTTEYGGIVEAEGQRVRAVLFVPRASQRRHDREFVASQDMIDASDRALAHYHFHAQKARNREFAGPSMPDLVTAARLGRTSLVFTSIDRDLLNADLYQPDGVLIDLGEVRRPRGE
ncbi:MAG: hypothetical protein KIS87_11355 [Phycisphaeraceae bacterium]|nr:hypothetical protein [Phycisphaeraceae bacterium]